MWYFYIRHFPCDRHPAKSGPRLDQRGLTKLCEFSTGIYFSLHMSLEFCLTEAEGSEEILCSLVACIFLCYLQRWASLNLLSAIVNCLKWCDVRDKSSCGYRMSVAVTGMRCNFLFFYMVTLNLKITQINDSHIRYTNLQRSFHFAVPHITNDHIHNHIQSEESVVMDNGKQTKFDG